jgi:hypothetical protein
LAKVIGADRGRPLLPRLAKHGQQQPHQDRNDPDADQQFDERKRVTFTPAHRGPVDRREYAAAFHVPLIQSCNILGKTLTCNRFHGG